MLPLLDRESKKIIMPTQSLDWYILFDKYTSMLYSTHKFLFLLSWYLLSCLSSIFVEKDTGRQRPQQGKPSKPSKKNCHSQQVRPAPPPRQPKEDSKASRHPFAMYASGEKDADMAGRKTHNVGPIASTNEVIEMWVNLAHVVTKHVSTGA